MSTTFNDIETYIMNRISTNWASTNIHWPGVQFDPKNTKYIQPRLITTELFQATVGYFGKNFIRGVVHCNVFVPIGTGSDTANELADLFRDLFPRALRIGPAGGRFQFGVSRVLPPIEDPIWYQLPVECPFHQFETVN